MKKATAKKGKVFVGLSGGVDSSVAALILKRDGYSVTGVFLRCYNLDGCAERDAEDARRVAEHLKIPFYVFDFEKEYKERVVKYMLEGYKIGITPNPDVMCNKEIKFGLFLEKALKLGADYVATGHYVRLVNREMKLTNSKSQLGIRKAELTNRNSKLVIKNYKLPFTTYQLHVAIDSNKDQSYFLWTLTQEQLNHSLFPIGDFTKPEVRAIARKTGLPTAKKKDSQGICFLGQISVFDFLKKHLPKKRGNVITAKGEKIGEHEGVWFYTIGQRHLGIQYMIKKSAKKNGDRGPFYVAKKDLKTNTLIMSEGEENKELFRKEVKLTDVHFINNVGLLSRAKLPVFARVRYRQPVQKAVLVRHGIKNKMYALHFAKPMKFIAEGQSAVLYSKKGEMIGGGVIQN